MKSFSDGDAVTIVLTPRNKLSGDVGVPGSLTITIRNPLGVDTVYAYGTDPEVTLLAVDTGEFPAGSYAFEKKLYNPTPGVQAIWYARWNGIGGTAEGSTKDQAFAIVGTLISNPMG